MYLVFSFFYCTVGTSTSAALGSFELNLKFITALPPAFLSVRNTPGGEVLRNERKSTGNKSLTNCLFQKPPDGGYCLMQDSSVDVRVPPCFKRLL